MREPASKYEVKQILLNDLAELLKKCCDSCADLLSLDIVPSDSKDLRYGFNGCVCAFFGTNDTPSYVKTIPVDKAEGAELIEIVCREIRKQKPLHDDTVQELATAIVYQACVDYKMAISEIKKNGKDAEIWDYGVRKPAKASRDECTRFFKSAWFSQLTSIDPDSIIAALNYRNEIGDL